MSGLLKASQHEVPRSMNGRERFRPIFLALSVPEWTADIVALAALAGSLYSIKVAREIAHEQIQRDA
jgi:hypothetical protein